MELRQAQDMPELLRELGIKYDPDRLAEVLKSRGGEVRARAIKITASVGAFLARILKVGILWLTQCQKTLLSTKQTNVRAFKLLERIAYSKCV